MLHLNKNIIVIHRFIINNNSLTYILKVGYANIIWFSNEEEFERLKENLVKLLSARQMNEACLSKSASFVIVSCHVQKNEQLITVATDKRIPKSKVPLTKEKFHAILG